jgi:hypothetical protein
LKLLKKPVHIDIDKRRKKRDEERDERCVVDPKRTITMHGIHCHGEGNLPDEVKNEHEEKEEEEKDRYELPSSLISGSAHDPTAENRNAPRSP